MDNVQTVVRGHEAVLRKILAALSCGGHVLLEDGLLLALVFLGSLLRIAARILRLRRGAGVDELGAETLYLFLDSWTDVIGLDHGAKSLGGGDCL